MGAVGQRRVARPEDPVGWHVRTELLLQRRLYIDLGEHAEALCLQRQRDTSQRVRERQPNGLAEAVPGVHACPHLVGAGVGFIHC